MQTNLNRRSFLGGVLALTGAAIVKPSLGLVHARPAIWADMIHDDAPGLNALFARQPVDIMSDKVLIDRSHGLVLKGGSFLLRSTVNIENGKNIMLYGNTFEASGDMDGQVMLSVKQVDGLVIESNMFMYPTAKLGPEFSVLSWP